MVMVDKAISCSDPTAGLIWDTVNLMLQYYACQTGKVNLTTVHVSPTFLSLPLYNALSLNIVMTALKLML